ncbi:MAG: APC family permease [Xanthomonadaceae bacterium]|nr:APC family permease [Xanthomonadaceae bacterium]
MGFGKIKRFIIGAPIATQKAHQELIPKWKALAVLSSDALSSVAYATEEILIPLAAVATAAMIWSIPISLAIIALLLILTISYHQTIKAYPNGGGAYIVAKENLGETAGLVAGGALLIDYVLTVAVSVSAGVENIVSAFPALGQWRIVIDSALILVIMLTNLRGVRESSGIFAYPTYFFIFSMFTMLSVGFYKVFTEQVANIVPVTHQIYPEIGLFLILRAFASGCAALTGVEAISNGIPLFRSPAQRNARITLSWMSVILGTVFIGMTVLAHWFNIVPGNGETVISSLARSVFGDNYLYYVLQISVALILMLAANTSYADFPRLSSLLARDRYLPRQLASQGDRLVFSNGVLGLSFCSIMLIYFVGGDTHHLIPLYAVGVFLSFTLSQSGMVVHHLRHKELHWRKGIAINALGAVTTGIVLVVIASTKFLHGAWMVVIAIPVLVYMFKKINTHYLATGKQLSMGDQKPPFKLAPMKHTVLIPISGVHRGIIDALRYAVTMSKDVMGVYVELEPGQGERFRTEWNKWAPQVPIVVLPSPFRSLSGPLFKFVDETIDSGEVEYITVLIPEFVTTKWWHRALHNQTAFLIRAGLAFKPNVAVISVRYHLDDKNS